MQAAKPLRTSNNEKNAFKALVILVISSGV